MKTGGMRPRLLVIDDEPPLRELFQRLFEDQGYEVSLAADGREGWDLVQSRPFDLVISDMKMPNMEGLEFLGLLKERHPDIEIILMSGFSEPGTAGASIKCGAYDFIAKPFRSEDLIRLAGRALEKRRVNLLADQLPEHQRPQGRLVAELEPASLALAREILESSQALLDSGPQSPEQGALARAIVSHAEKLLVSVKPAAKARMFL